MTKEDVLQEFKAAGAFLSGHFILSSGLHSDTYLQCARVLMDPRRAERLANALAQKILAMGVGPIDYVVSPAMGGVIIGYEVARHLGAGVLSVFFERVDGILTLRRGFSLPEGARCVMVEDVITTGLSSLECIAAASQEGAHVLAAASLVIRSSEVAQKFKIPLATLAEIPCPAWSPEALPTHLRSLPAVKPGSRTLMMVKG